MNLKPASFLLSLCYAGSAASIGLGDISVRSHLGQPLHATVALIGATPATLTDCFSLDAGAGSIAPPLHAQFSIEQVGGQTLLHIRTPKSINDPIVQFVVAADCEARLQREYVVLLDPPALLEAAVVSDTPATAEPAKTLEKTPSAFAVPRPTRRATRVKPSSHALPNARSVTAPPPTAASPRQTVTATPKPRLVISGKDGAQPDASLPLQPPAEQPARPLPGASDPAVTELSDDNTALSRRIAHLEMQLDRLNKRNAELDAMRAAATAHIAPPVPERPQWPLYLLAIGLLAGVGAFGNWLGRRSRNHPRNNFSDDMSWVQQTDNLPALSETAQTPEAEPEPMPKRMPAFIPPPATDESTEVSDGILDQAEVYMAHGHAELAIHLLQEHLREAPRESPVPWLLLLDLLHRAGDRAGHAAASTECSRYFNVNLVSQDTEAGNGLEAYPHLFDQLTQKWNSPEIYDFFDDLIYDHRGGTRLGFEPAAYREILLLRAIAQDVLPLAA